MEHLFERKEADKTSTLVTLQGNPLNYVKMLKRRWEDAGISGGKELHKGTAVALLLNKIPKDVIEQAIKRIIEERKKPSRKHSSHQS